MCIRDSYKTVAHIAPDRTVTIYDEEMPQAVREEIQRIADTSEMTISVTQEDVYKRQSQWCLSYFLSSTLKSPKGTLPTAASKKLSGICTVSKPFTERCV